MISHRVPHIKRWCWHCSELLEEDTHVTWFNARGEAMNLHTNCAMLMSRGLLANVHDVMRGTTEGNDNVTE